MVITWEEVEPVATQWVRNWSKRSLQDEQRAADVISYAWELLQRKPDRWESAVHLVQAACSGVRKGWLREFRTNVYAAQGADAVFDVPMDRGAVGTSEELEVVLRQIPNERHRQFAELLADGCTPTQAASRMGYSKQRGLQVLQAIQRHFGVSTWKRKRKSRAKPKDQHLKRGPKPKWVTPSRALVSKCRQ